jgi:tetratricopeptide (TPR) repeat protein
VVPDGFAAHLAYASFNQELKRYQKAELAYGWCLDWARRGEKNAELGDTLNNLALLDRDQNRAEQARQEYEEALKIRRELAQKDLDAYLPGVAQTLNNLRGMDYAEHRMKEAQAAGEEALKIYRELAQEGSGCLSAGRGADASQPGAA